MRKIFRHLQNIHQLSKYFCRLQLAKLKSQNKGISGTMPGVRTAAIPQEHIYTPSKYLRGQSRHTKDTQARM